MLKQTVTVTVLKPFESQGRAYTAGQAITVSPIDAVVMSRKRLVTLSKRRAVPAAPPPVPDPVVDEPPAAPEPPVELPKARRTYRRRDVQPDETTVLTASETTALDPEPDN